MISRTQSADNIPRPAQQQATIRSRKRPKTLAFGSSLSGGRSRSSPSGPLLSDSGSLQRLHRQGAFLSEPQSVPRIPAAHQPLIKIFSIEDSIPEQSEGLNVMYARPSFTERPDSDLDTTPARRRSRSSVSPSVGGLHKWSNQPAQTQSLPRFTSSSPVLDEMVFDEESEFEDDLNCTLGDDEREDCRASVEAVVDELDLLLLKSQRKLSKLFEAQQKTSGSQDRPGVTAFPSMLLRDIRSLRTIIRHRKALVSGSEDGSEDQDVKDVQSYHHRYLTANTGVSGEAGSIISPGDSNEDESVLPQPPFLTPSLGTERACHPQGLDNSFNSEEAVPAETPQSLEDCDCLASQLPVLDERGIESALSDCHNELFHSMPELTSSAEFAELLSAAARHMPTERLRDRWLEQVAEMLHVVNTQRSMALSAFSCSLDAFRVAAEDQEEFTAFRHQEKEEHERQIGAVEAGMSKQIANLLRVVEKQESQLVFQQHQINKLTEQSSRLQENVTGLSRQPSPGLRSPYRMSSTLDVRSSQGGERACSGRTTTSMPHLDKIVSSSGRTSATLLCTPGVRQQRVPDVVIGDGVDGSPELMGSRQLSSSGRFDDNPRWMARAVSWLDLSSRQDSEG